MTGLPSLRTVRLALRPFTLADASLVQQMAGAKEIASTTLNIPHPYEDGIAEAWIGTHAKRFEAGEAVVFAIERLRDGQLLGAVGLEIVKRDLKAELGYWIGKRFWNRGYCTEAAQAVMRHGFEALNLNRIQARHFSRNPASGRVMQKLGMHHEGTLRQYVRKWGRFEDLELYSILREDLSR